MESKIHLTVDGIPITAVRGQSVLDASLNAGIYIPHLCHHPALKPMGGLQTLFC